MPKVRPMTDSARLAADCAALARSVKALMGAKDMTLEGLAARLGISESTLRRKLKSPGTFTFSEIWKIKRLGGEENDLAS